MFPNFLITFRETLEATLIISIVLSYLAKTKQTRYNMVVYLGSLAGVITSLIGAVLFSKLANGFEGRIEEIFEGITMILASVFLTTMIVWMIKQRDIAKNLTEKIAKKIERVRKTEIFLLIFFSILREGIEVVLLLSALSFGEGSSFTKTNFIFSLSGVIVAGFIGYLIFKSTKKINLKIFFSAANIMLILFAAGLFAHGVHEFQEARIIPIIIEHVWDINFILDEKGILGSFMKGIFGYNGNPSLIEITSYILYLTGFWIVYKRKC